MLEDCELTKLTSLWVLRFSWQWRYKLRSSGLWRHVVLW